MRGDSIRGRLMRLEKLLKSEELPPAMDKYLSQQYPKEYAAMLAMNVSDKLLMVFSLAARECAARL